MDKTLLKGWEDQKTSFSKPSKVPGKHEVLRGSVQEHPGQAEHEQALRTYPVLSCKTKSLIK